MSDRLMLTLFLIAVVSIFTFVGVDTVLSDQETACIVAEREAEGRLLDAMSNAEWDAFWDAAQTTLVECPDSERIAVLAPNGEPYVTWTKDEVEYHLFIDARDVETVVRRVMQEGAK